MTIKRKAFTATGVKFASDADATGEFIAQFAQLNVIDRDGDVLVPGIIAGADAGPVKVRIASWGHKWHELPVGIGEVYEADGALYCAGKFFMDTEGGADTYRTVKGLADLGEWSFGFDILESENGQHDGKSVRVLKSLRIFEVSPVLQGAGIGTHTVAMKGAPCPTCGAKADPDEIDDEDDEEDSDEENPAKGSETDDALCADCENPKDECSCGGKNADDEDVKAASATAVLHYEVTRAKSLGVCID